MPAKRLKDKSEPSYVSLSTPWRDPKQCRLVPSMINSIGMASDEVVDMFVKERTRLHESYVREQERTKRVAMLLSAILIVTAAGMVLFAPAGRETLSYWIGVALVIFAAGAMGYQRVWGKSKNISFGADQHHRNL